MKYLALLLLPLYVFVWTMFISPQVFAADAFNGSCNAKPSDANYNKKLIDSDVCKDVRSQQDDPQNTNPVISIIKVAIDIISFVVGAAAIIGILASCIRLITASGDAASISTARSGIVYSLIGVAVVILAQSIVIFVLSKVK